MKALPATMGCLLAFRISTPSGTCHKVHDVDCVKHLRFFFVSMSGLVLTLYQIPYFSGSKNNGFNN